MAGVNWASLTPYWRRVRRLLPFPKRRAIRRYFPRFADRNIARLLSDNAVSRVLDVGANEGQFARKLRDCGYDGDIVSFEPIAAVHQVLCAAAKADARWSVYKPVALGDRDGVVAINVMKESKLSSTLAMIGRAPVATEIVAMRKLDSLFGELNLSETQGLAIKIDVQGFEQSVLEGAKATIQRARVLLLELCLIPTYEGEAYYLDILNALHEQNFRAVFFSPVTSRDRYGVMYQVDVLLVRADRLPPV